MMTIIDYIKADTQQLKAMIDALEFAQDKKNQLLELRKAIALHEIAEEQVLYSKLEREHQPFIFRAYENHQQVDKILEELDSLITDSAKWSAKFTLFKEAFDYHTNVCHEKMFELARKMFDETTLQAMAAEMDVAKAKLAETGTVRN